MTPYIYIIGWTKQNTYYLGVQYGKDANPENLWTKYFTSSNYVKDYRNQYGEPDIIKIRKTFDCPVKARCYESTIIRRMKLIHDDRFLNKANNGENWSYSENAKESIRNSQIIGTRIKATCPHCGKTGQAAAMGTWHFDYCKQNPKNKPHNRTMIPWNKGRKETDAEKAKHYEARKDRALKTVKNRKPRKPKEYYL